MNKINSKIIADSKAPDGTRLTSFILQFPRMVLAEFNTHRALSRNSASSRAIPFKTMLNMVRTDPFVPIKFQKDHSGMQGTEYLEGHHEELAKKYWIEAANSAADHAIDFHTLGAGLPDPDDTQTVLDFYKKSPKVTKQLANRMLEPYLWHTVIATATDWENYFALRAHTAAEIHIEKLAQTMLEEYNKSIPKSLDYGDWHIPFGDKFNDDKLLKMVEDLPEKRYKNWPPLGIPRDLYNELKVKIATARCARVSYLNYEGTDDYTKDLILHDMLSNSGHWSPFEHCAKAGFHSNSNFSGEWIQYRKMFKNENRKDERVKRK